MQQQWASISVSAGISILWLLCSGVLAFTTISQTQPAMTASVVLAFSLLILSSSLCSQVGIFLATARVESKSDILSAAINADTLRWLCATAMGLATFIIIATLMEMNTRGLVSIISWGSAAFLEAGVFGFLVWNQMNLSKSDFVLGATKKSNAAASASVVSSTPSDLPTPIVASTTLQNNSDQSSHSTSPALDALRTNQPSAGFENHPPLERPAASTLHEPSAVSGGPGVTDLETLSSEAGNSANEIFSFEQDSATQLSEGTRQQIVDRLDDQGYRQILGLTRCTIDPGQQTAIIQLAFSPPFELAPELETMADLDNIQIKIANLLPHGARLEVKRPISATACDVIVEWIAQEAA